MKKSLLVTMLVCGCALFGCGQQEVSLLDNLQYETYGEAGKEIAILVHIDTNESYDFNAIAQELESQYPDTFVYICFTNHVEGIIDIKNDVYYYYDEYNGVSEDGEFFLMAYNKYNCY